ncbi:MAG: GDSL-type esterase/lipase family protein [Fibromonadaceae bacterium]|jgi:lysophospholipase L1-like esterase|nr:GDSL-type esterase/lipase family protein [Fibromonadaceae bacterium]
MMHIYLLFGILVSNVIAQTIISPFDSAVSINGRFAKEADIARASFSGVEFIIAFEGTEASILLKSPGNVFSVTLDGKQMPPLDLSANANEKHLIAKNLAKGIHVISVAKRTESIQGDALFKGFEIKGVPKKEALPQKPKLKIEFLGNSITAGYGVLDPVKEHTYSPKTQDVFSSYAGVAAKELDAEMRTVAFSGRGIFRNNSDSGDRRTLPEFFPYTSVNSKIPWDFSWQPDIAVIELGTNDFAVGAPDSAGFVNSMVKFAKQVKEKYPDAQIIITDGPMLNDFWPKGVPSLTLCKKFLDASKTELAKQGISVHRFSFSRQDGSLGYGADWHPSKRQAEKNGRELAEFVKQLL